MLIAIKFDSSYLTFLFLNLTSKWLETNCHIIQIFMSHPGDSYASLCTIYIYIIRHSVYDMQFISYVYVLYIVHMSLSTTYSSYVMSVYGIQFIYQSVYDIFSSCAILRMIYSLCAISVWYTVQWGLTNTIVKYKKRIKDRKLWNLRMCSWQQLRETHDFLTQKKRNDNNSFEMKPKNNEKPSLLQKYKESFSIKVEEEVIISICDP